MLEWIGSTFIANNTLPKLTITTPHVEQLTLIEVMNTPKQNIFAILPSGSVHVDTRHRLEDV